MKRLLTLLCLPGLLAGCVALPYDADTMYYPAPAVNAQISSGYYYPYSSPPYPYYQPPTYVAPAPVIVPPAIQFNYSRNVRPGLQNYPHPRHEDFRDRAQPDLQRREGARNEWRRPDGGRDDGRRDGWRDGQRDWQHRDFRGR